MEGHAKEVAYVKDLSKDHYVAGFIERGLSIHTHVRPYISDIGARTRGYTPSGRIHGAYNEVAYSKCIRKQEYAQRHGRDRRVGDMIFLCEGR